MRDFPNGFVDVIDEAATGLADSIVEGLSPAASEALGDPIVRAMMAADRVDHADLAQLLRTTADKIHGHRHAHYHHNQRLCRAGRA
jgi:hypothetical protein